MKGETLSRELNELKVAERERASGLLATISRAAAARSAANCVSTCIIRRPVEGDGGGGGPPLTDANAFNCS